MSRVFLSWYDGITEPSGAVLLDALLSHVLDVEYSAHSPHSGRDDPRWKAWYALGLPQAVEKADAFVAVVTAVYASTWMGVEFQVAVDRHRREGRPLLFVYYAGAERLPRGFATYEAAATELPHDPREAAERVTEMIRHGESAGDP